MPIPDFEGNTFVAYIDISGFKDFMGEDHNKALNTLKQFYSSGYDIVSNNFLKNSSEYVGIEGIFISDCGILFIRDVSDLKTSLKSLLWGVKEINQKMLKNRIMVTTSIAFGHLKYEKKIELVGIAKNFIYGDAYVSAYLDTDYGKSKILPGECRIVKKNFPLSEEFKNFSNEDILKLINSKNSDNEHYYFYWMVNKPSNILEFEKGYLKSYKSRFNAIIRILRKFND